MLKPCPFCGKTDTLIMADDWDDLAVLDVEPTSDNSFAVTCDFTAGGCGAQGGYRKTPEDAEAAWNARPAAAVDELIEAYRAVVYEEACLHCGKGEAWTVKCPDGTYLCETWGDSDGQANAEEMAGALNCAYKQGYAAARAALTGEE